MPTPASFLSTRLHLPLIFRFAFSVWARECVTLARSKISSEISRRASPHILGHNTQVDIRWQARQSVTVTLYPMAGKLSLLEG